MSTVKSLAGAGLVAVLLAGCGSPQDSRLSALEGRIAQLEREVKRLRAGGTAKASEAKASESAAPVAFHTDWKDVPLGDPVEKGLKWLVSVQGEDGGWGQDGGRSADPRKGVKLETQGNDVANTSLVALAILRSGTTPTEGPYRDALNKAIGFVLKHVEAAPTKGLAVTTRQGTQIQRKLGPHIDTFLATQLLSEVDGGMADAGSRKRVRSALEKTVAKIEKHQGADGSWNAGGGWAPVLATSAASRGLYAAMEKGVAVNRTVLAKVDTYTKSKYDPQKKSFGAGDSAGVELYAAAQALEQSSRRLAARPAAPAAGAPAPAASAFTADEAREVQSATTAKLAQARFTAGFGSMGGEEFISYLNISDSLLRTGGEEWEKWNEKIKERLVKLQNDDGTWAGHHCITGRVACTAASVMTLLAERGAAKP